MQSRTGDSSSHGLIRWRPNNCKVAQATLDFTNYTGQRYLPVLTGTGGAHSAQMLVSNIYV